MNPSAEQIHDYLQNLDKGLVKKDDLVKLFKVFMKILKDLKSTHDGQLVSSKDALVKFSKQFKKDVEKMEKNINEISLHLESSSAQQMTKVALFISSEVTRIEKLIARKSSPEEIFKTVNKSFKALIQEEFTGRNIVNKINDLPIRRELQIGKEHIRDLVEELRELRELLESRRFVGGGGGGRRIPVMSKYSLTSQCNGVTKTFTLPINTMDVIGVFGTQFPVQFDPSADWTFAAGTLTLGDSVGAPETGQTLWALIETL